MKKGTVGRILRRFREKGIVSTPIIKQHELVFPGDKRPKRKRGYFEYPPNILETVRNSNAGVESVRKVSTFDMNVLKLHRLDVLALVPGLWGRLVDRANLTYVEARNLSRYNGRSKVLGHRVELFRNSARYRAHSEAIPFSGVYNEVLDFLMTLEYFGDVQREDILRLVIPSFEAVVDLPVADPDPQLGYLKLYFKDAPSLGKSFVRTECFLRNLNLSPPLDHDDEITVASKMLRGIDHFDDTRNVLREKVGLPQGFFVSSFHELAWKGVELRPKFRLAKEEERSARK